jgi:hypothetical protein
MQITLNLQTSLRYLQKRCSVLIVAIVLPLAALLSGNLAAEQKAVFDGYEVHYSAFRSTFLTPEVARQYEIVRSKAIGVINISVLKTDPAGSTALPKAVTANVQAMLTNNIQQQRHLDFRRVIEGTAIYYIAQFQYSQNELLVFDISAQPEGSPTPLKLRFSQTFFND